MKLALARVSAVLGMDAGRLLGLTRSVFRRGGVLAVSRGEQEVTVSLGGVEPGGVFELASVTKSFTGALAGALVEAGRLDWEAPLAGLGGPFTRLPAHLTPLALSTHTAGLPMHPARASVTVFTRFHDPYGGMSAADVIASARRWARPTVPARFAYSNLGAGLLALALAHAAGEELSAAGYGRALRGWVTGPLGLDVSLTPAGAVVRPAGPLGGAGMTGFGPLAGAGGLFGTAADLLRFGDSGRRPRPCCVRRACPGTSAASPPAGWYPAPTARRSGTTVWRAAPARRWGWISERARWSSCWRAAPIRRWACAGPCQRCCCRCWGRGRGKAFFPGGWAQLTITASSCSAIMRRKASTYCGSNCRPAWARISARARSRVQAGL
jgi:CubicO group peptidase (beta-lactamase class C family)